jgi:hypothetical protein
MLGGFHFFVRTISSSFCITFPKKSKSLCKIHKREPTKVLNFWNKLLKKNSNNSLNVNSHKSKANWFSKVVLTSQLSNFELFPTKWFYFLITKITKNSKNNNARRTNDKAKQLKQQCKKSQIKTQKKHSKPK